MDYPNPDQNTRFLRYLDLSIPETSHEKYKGATRQCNFARNPNIHHTWHNQINSDIGRQLNTMVDLVVNLSEHLSGADVEIIDLLKKLGKKNSVEIPTQLIEKVNTIHKNQDYLQKQIEILMERVNKTLNKADKFPSKKDIRAFTEEIKEVVKIPNEIENRILELTHKQEQLLKQQAEEDAKNLRKILRAVEKVRLTFIGDDPDGAEYNLDI